MTNHAQELAEQIAQASPDAGKQAWGEAFIAAADEHPDLAGWLRDKLVDAAGAYVARVIARRRAQERAARLLARGVSVATGRLVAPTISVRTEGGTQLVLWIDATPHQFVQAVVRERNVLAGRMQANTARAVVAQAIEADDELMSLATLADVCDRLGVDPDALGLAELERPA